MKLRTIAAPVLALSVIALATSCAGGGGEASDTDGEVTIGAILSLSGIYSTLGPAQKNAIEMGLEALNETGFTVDGKEHTMAFDIVDDKSDAATTGVAALRQMVQSDHLPVVAFELGAATYAPQLERTPVPMINIVDSTYPLITEHSDQIFLLHGGGSTENYVPGCLEYAGTEFGASTIGIIDTIGEPYGEGQTVFLDEVASDFGFTISATGSAPVGSPDYSPAIEKVLATTPDVVYVSSATSVVLPVIKQIRDLGYTGPIMHSAGINPDQAESILGANFNSIMTNNYDCAGALPTTSDDPRQQQFAADYHERFDAYPQDLTMWAYDLPFVIAKAMTEAGTTTDSAKIRDALTEITAPEETISGWIPSSSGTMFDDRRNAPSPAEVTQWCPDGATLGRAMLYNPDGREVPDPQYFDACANID